MLSSIYRYFDACGWGCGGVQGFACLIPSVASDCDDVELGLEHSSSLHHDACSSKDVVMCEIR